MAEAAVAAAAVVAAVVEVPQVPEMTDEEQLRQILAWIGFANQEQRNRIVQESF